MSFKLISNLKALRKKRTDILSKLAANKVISDDLTIEDVANIDEYMQWAAENLPDFITIENIDTLGNNMKSGGQRVGAFVMALSKIAGKETIKGTIYAGTSTRHAYHEAFHAIFELLLTEEQQNQYYKIAKKELLAKLRSEGKSFTSALEELKNSDRDKYKNYSKEKLEKLLYEEYMADEFEKFKQNPKNTKASSWIKSLFNKMLEWIRNVLGTYNAKELQLLFEEVNFGKGCYFFNCGPKKMVEAVMPLELSVADKDNIFSSVDYMTKCGVGICGSCVDRKGRRSCIEGPFLNE